MKVEFIGTYDSHEIRKTSKDKDYVFLVCRQAVDGSQFRFGIEARIPIMGM